MPQPPSGSSCGEREATHLRGRDVRRHRKGVRVGANVDQRRTGVGQRAREGIANIGWFGDPDRVDPERRGDSGEVDMIMVGPERRIARRQHLQADHTEAGVVEDHDLDRQAVRLRGQQLAQEHGQATVTGQRDDLPVRAAHRSSDSHRQRVGHRAVYPGAEQPPPPVGRDVAGGPGAAHACIRGEDRALVGYFVDDRGEILGMDRLLAAHVGAVGVDAVADGSFMGAEHVVEERAVTALLQVRQQRPNGQAEVGGDALGQWDAPPQARRVDVDLDVVLDREEVVVREVGTQEEHQVSVVQ